MKLMISACYCVITWFGLLSHTVKHTGGYYLLTGKSYLFKSPKTLLQISIIKQRDTQHIHLMYKNQQCLLIYDDRKVKLLPLSK